jgi:hypothetical protein
MTGLAPAVAPARDDHRHGLRDVKHGNRQTGRAPNDLEIHPVLRFTQVRCRQEKRRLLRGWVLGDAP